MHGKGERKASKGLLFASCMDDAMVELVELRSGSAQAKAKRESSEKTTGEREERGDAHGLLTSSCDNGRAGSCARPYTVYARQVKREQTGE
jgi:hypothetical protein